MMPIERLQGLIERERGFSDLLNQSGALSVAAWKLASARCQTWSTSTRVPTSSEVRAAAIELARRSGEAGAVPNASVLRADCEARGLLEL